jgi:hypothetical protein
MAAPIRPTLIVANPSFMVAAPSPPSSLPPEEGCEPDPELVWVPEPVEEAESEAKVEDSTAEVASTETVEVPTSTVK